tara:strand:- start:38 stop:1444 length:1407 start_codon:yes stop_codon:yes gene_type:complete
MTTSTVETNKSLISKEVTQEQMDNFNLDVYLISLMWNEPFYANIIRQINKTETTKIPTAGVYVKDGEIHMMWNRKFLAGLSKKEVFGLLKHEAMHLIFSHTTTRRFDPHIVWNYATDLAINSMIPEDELPEGGLIPSKKFKPLTREQIAQMGHQAAERYNMISAKIASFPKNKNAEWYFTQLMEDPEIKEAIESSQKMQGKSLEEALADGTVKIDEDGNLVDQDGNAVTVVPSENGDGTMDNHDGWDDMSDGERQKVEGKIKVALEKSIKECDRTNKWGSVSSEMRSTIRGLVSREIPWQSVLKQFCGMSRRADRASSIRRIHRKYPGIHPGAFRDYKSNIAVYVDQSGSVSDSDLELLSGELESLAKRVTFTMFNFDTSVDTDSETEYRKGKRINIQRTRCGGTCFTCVIEHANKNKSKFDGILILTDGYASEPKPKTNMKVGWVIVPDGKLAFRKKSRDFLIQMKE